MFIEEAKLFRGIAFHVINEIIEIASEEVLPEGHIVFKMGDFSDYLYVLEEGEINLTVEGKTPISFAVNKPGNLFGWSALMEPNRYTASAKCVKESKIIKIDGDRLMQILKRNPEVGLTFMKRFAGVIAMRLVRIYQEVTGSQIYSKEDICGFAF